MIAGSKLDGIHFMLPTPFDADGDVDLASFSRLVACARSAGCTGVVTLGVMGEAPRLTDSERGPIIDAVVAAAGDDVTVTVGVSAESGRTLAARVRGCSVGRRDRGDDRPGHDGKTQSGINLRLLCSRAGSDQSPDHCAGFAGPDGGSP